MERRTEALPAPQLTDPIWTVEHVAAALRIRTRAARDVIARPDFPSPSRLGPSRTARLYWLADDVLGWMRGLATTAQPAASANTGPQPRNAAPKLHVARNTTVRSASGAMSAEDALALIDSLPTARGRVAA